MIVLDIETTGVDFVRCGIWQIGAIDLETGEEFLQEARIDNEDEIINLDVEKPVLEVIGKTEEQLRDNSKQSQKQMIENFLNWVKTKKFQSFICHNPQFDIAFIKSKTEKYGLRMPINFKAFDLHSIAQTKFFELNNKFSLSEEKKGSDLSLSIIIEFCGLRDERGIHNALEDCKLTAECFSRLVYRKTMFKEYIKFKIPDYLKNDNL